MEREKKSDAILPFLVDNSTYFSFKAAISGSALDASMLYNLSNFLECLVFSDLLQQHKIAFLIKLQRKRDMDEALSELISRTFGCHVSKEELAKFQKQIRY